MESTSPSTVRKDVHTQQQHYPAIDALRGIAVILVLLHHYSPPALSNILGLGDTGVDIFFLLSGFLITGILLGYKEVKTFSDSVKTFYYRRSLRIFPLYYLYLVIVFTLFNIPLIEQVSAVFYYFNYHCISVGGNTSVLLSHFWSLAVEEQFYLIWPFVILLTPYRFLKIVIIACIIGSLIFCWRRLAIYGPYNVPVKMELHGYMHLASCIQSLAAGALIAILHKEGSRIILAIRRFWKALLAVAVCLWIIDLAIIYAGYEGGVAFLRTINVCMGAVILCRLIISGKKAPRIFRSEVLGFVGKISYGIYVYHILVRELLQPFIGNLLPGYNFWLTLPVYTACTITLAYLSFRYIESPINRLKNRWPETLPETDRQNTQKNKVAVSLLLIRNQLKTRRRRG